MITLAEQQLRVLGVLMEKALTTPGAYPMTLNSIVLACNQKQNRDPVVEYVESDVARALHELMLHDLAAEAPPAHGARANRFKHRVVEKFHWDPREQALMTELILRGRQTAGELRTRASRMTDFPDMAGVNAILRSLIESDPPYVEELAREPGRSANRFRHLLGGEKGGIVRPSPSSESAETGPNDLDALLARMTSLETQVDKLTSLVDELQKQVGSLDPQRRPEV